MRKVAVIAIQKSHATIACAWLRTKVAQRWDCPRVPEPWSRRFGMYFRTVRGDTRRPSFSNSSLVMRSWPHVGFSRAIWRMSARNSSGIGGRPGCDFQRQKRRNPWRCHRVKVSGVTTASVCLQSHQRLSQTRAKRVAFVGRFGLTSRS